MNQDPPQGKQSAAPLAGRTLSLPKKLLFSIVVTAVVMLTMECALACLWRPPPEDDPYVGFSASVPLLIQESVDENDESTTGGRIAINPAKWVWFNDQSFAAIKPRGTVRIVCLGGSTTYGRPFGDETSFCGWLRTLLPMVDSGRRWEVINAGGISYASYRVARVMQEFADYDVDYFVLYTGHNEFLEWRTYGDLVAPPSPLRSLQTLLRRSHLARSVGSVVARFRPATRTDNKHVLSAEVDEILNHSIGPASYRRDPDWQRGVVEHFRVNLARMEQISRAAGARLVMVMPEANLRDCAPFKSDFSDEPGETRKPALQKRWAEAQRRYGEADFPGAVEELDAILSQDQENAEVHFLRGRAALRLGQNELALRRLRAAINADICPLRATDPIRDALRAFASDSDVIAVDFPSHLADLARSSLGHACLGSESFLDHVHPTIAMHGELARCILQALRREHVIDAVPNADQFAAASLLVEALIDRQAQATAFRNLAKLTHWAGKFEEAQRHAEDALRLTPEDLESRFILADCLYKAGRDHQAIDQYNRLFDGGSFDRALLPFGELLAEAGHLDAAKAYLIQAVLANQGGRQAASYESLGKLHQALGERELAGECFENAARLRAE